MRKGLAEGAGIVAGHERIGGVVKFNPHPASLRH
jgi:hypothetical protein